MTYHAWGKTLTKNGGDHRSLKLRIKGSIKFSAFHKKGHNDRRGSSLMQEFQITKDLDQNKQNSDKL